MHQLVDLKEFFETHKIEVVEFGGWYLKTKKDIWTMAYDTFYKNGEPIVEKEFVQSIVPSKKKRRKYV